MMLSVLALFLSLTHTHSHTHSLSLLSLSLSDFFLPAKTMERLDLHEENDDCEDEVDAQEEDDKEKMDVSVVTVLTPATGMRSTLKIQ